MKNTCSLKKSNHRNLKIAKFEALKICFTSVNFMKLSSITKYMVGESL